MPYSVQVREVPTALAIPRPLATYVGDDLPDRCWPPILSRTLADRPCLATKGTQHRDRCARVKGGRRSVDRVADRPLFPGLRQGLMTIAVFHDSCFRAKLQDSSMSGTKRICLRGELESVGMLAVMKPSIEKVATDFDCPCEFVEQLYAGELSVLEREARIQTFVPVVALRRVREALRERRSRHDGSLARRRRSTVQRTSSLRGPATDSAPRPNAA